MTATPKPSRIRDLTRQLQSEIESHRATIRKLEEERESILHYGLDEKSVRARAEQLVASWGDEAKSYYASVAVDLGRQEHAGRTNKPYPESWLSLLASLNAPALVDRLVSEALARWPDRMAPRQWQEELQRYDAAILRAEEAEEAIITEAEEEGLLTIPRRSDASVRVVFSIVEDRPGHVISWNRARYAAWSQKARAVNARLREIQEQANELRTAAARKSSSMRPITPADKAEVDRLNKERQALLAEAEALQAANAPLTQLLSACRQVLLAAGQSPDESQFAPARDQML